MQLARALTTISYTISQQLGSAWIPGNCNSCRIKKQDNLQGTILLQFFRFCVLKSPKKVSNPTSIIEQNAQLGMKSYSKKKIAVKIVLMLRKFLVAFKYRFDSITRMPSLSLWDNVHSIGHLASSGIRARWWWRRSVCSINALIASHGHTRWW